MENEKPQSFIDSKLRMAVCLCCVVRGRDMLVASSMTWYCVLRLVVKYFLFFSFLSHLFYCNFLADLGT